MNIFRQLDDNARFVEALVAADRAMDEAERRDSETEPPAEDRAFLRLGEALNGAHGWLRGFDAALSTLEADRRFTPEKLRAMIRAWTVEMADPFDPVLAALTDVEHAAPSGAGDGE